VSTATQTKTYGCTRCGRHTTKPTDWAIRGGDVVVQGIHLGTCKTCLVGGEISDECGGKCDGKYHVSHGTYYLAEQRDAGGFKWEHGWSCWDEKCVEGWEPDDDGDMCECPHCEGEHVQVRHVVITDGERVKEGRAYR
jgi:hypothetical protein